MIHLGYRYHLLENIYASVIFPTYESETSSLDDGTKVASKVPDIPKVISKG
ncbi:hypothetical protein ACFPDQ_03060 [Pseudofrancisella aestuarii]|uniref:Uncharacterized protein n=1 Tax=Pseudofrancisella aestuarii TaxID=2670347 RepID=A0ABV9TB72_9GAMM|nr:hypothetical protein [Pseudofrancisella aestuarii]